VEKAGEIVAKLLQPMDDEMNDHKQKQLRELALINGTLREEEYCHICGEKGHRGFECPTRNSKCLTTLMVWVYQDRTGVVMVEVLVSVPLVAVEVAELQMVAVTGSLVGKCFFIRSNTDDYLVGGRV